MWQSPLFGPSQGWTPPGSNLQSKTHMDARPTGPTTISVQAYGAADDVEDSLANSEGYVRCLHTKPSVQIPSGLPIYRPSHEKLDAGGGI